MAHVQPGLSFCNCHVGFHYNQTFNNHQLLALPNKNSKSDTFYSGKEKKKKGKIEIPIMLLLWWSLLYDPSYLVGHFLMGRGPIQHPKMFMGLSVKWFTRTFFFVQKCRCDRPWVENNVAPLIPSLTHRAKHRSGNNACHTSLFHDKPLLVSMAFKY